MSRSHSGRAFYAGLIQALTEVLGAAKGYLADHGPRVAVLAAKIADRMGLSSKETSQVFLAAILSDMGMVGLAEEAWEHPVVDLPPEVRARVKRHPVRSEARVGLIPHLEELAPLVRHHHEWWDGTGYPDGLAGREIPIGAQILRLADTVVALSQPRPQRRALGADAIGDIVARSVGIEFGPEVARTFLGLWNSGYVPEYRPQTFRLALEHAVGDLLPDRVSPLSNGQLLTILANLIDAKDPYTAGHSRRVALLATAVGANMGFREHMRSALWAGGYLHDLGKLAVPLSVLTKVGKLDATEEVLMRSHAALGADILESIAPLRHLAPGARHHHERWDGGGYPDGLVGDDIPLIAQILAVCDSYDAMTTARAYRDSRSHEDAAAEIARCSGTHYCPRVVETFLALPHEIFTAVRAEARASRSPAVMELPLFPSPAVEPSFPLRYAV
jgi:HD-GYP domain-containing protein (c-di-GMP phosphodiesterase class II)